MKILTKLLRTELKLPNHFIVYFKREGRKICTMRYTFMRICINILTWMLLSHLGYAQVYNFTTYTPSDGLIQSQVRAILQDHQRFLWLGTHGGISKYDGRQFINYTPEDSLVSDFVTCLYQDTQLNICQLL